MGWRTGSWTPDRPLQRGRSTAFPILNYPQRFSLARPLPRGRDTQTDRNIKIIYIWRNGHERTALLFTEKTGFDVEAQGLLGALRDQLGIRGLESVVILNRYDADQIDPAIYEQAKGIVFSEPQVDAVYDETFPVPEYPHRTPGGGALPGSSTSGPTPPPSASSSWPGWTAP